MRESALGPNEKLSGMFTREVHPSNICATFVQFSQMNISETAIEESEEHPLNMLPMFSAFPVSSEAISMETRFEHPANMFQKEVTLLVSR